MFLGSWTDPTEVPFSDVPGHEHPDIDDIINASNRLKDHFGGDSSSVYVVVLPTGKATKSTTSRGGRDCAWHF